MSVFRPASESDVLDAVRAALERGEPLQVEGGATKAAMGKSTQASKLDMRRLNGVVDYEPRELILKTRPGALLSEIETLLASERQMLAFEPFDYGPVYGAATGAATIGGVIAAGVSGSRRITAGAARDHTLGVRGVSGRGETFVAGGNVIKNVTGYDLPKLMAGSWGRLAVLTEITLKVTPLPEASSTYALFGVDAEKAVAAMALALGSAAAIDAAAYGSGLAGDKPAAIFRMSGFAPSFAERERMLREALSDIGVIEEAGGAAWKAIKTLEPLPLERPLWRLGVPARNGARAAAALERHGGVSLLDWGGALVWSAIEAPADMVRGLATELGGHATLIRAGKEMREKTPAFHPAQPGVAALETRIRRAFDPQSVFETGRF